MPVSLDALITQYGYAAVIAGTFLEGETILVLAGLAAHRGYLSLPLVMAAAFTGTVFGDQLFFYLGRRHAGFILRRRPAWRDRIEKVKTLLDRYQTPVILAFRFLYGMRTITPFVIGMSRVPVWKFILFNVAGAAVWTLIIGAGGYSFGYAVETVLGDIKRYEIWVFSAVAVLGTGAWGYHFLRGRGKGRPPTRLPSKRN